MKLKISLSASPLDVGQLISYLEGSKVDSAFVEHVTALRSKERPKVLYRLCQLTRVTDMGKTVSVSKELVSASDTVENAIYAGCSYHAYNTKGVSTKTFALIEVRSPIVLLSLKEIRKILVVDGSLNLKYHLQRLDAEREYFILGPTSGKVLRIIDPGLFRRVKKLNNAGIPADALAAMLEELR